VVPAVALAAAKTSTSDVGGLSKTVTFQSSSQVTLSLTPQQDTQTLANKVGGQNDDDRSGGGGDAANDPLRAVGDVLQKVRRFVKRNFHLDILPEAPPPPRPPEEAPTPPAPPASEETRQEGPLDVVFADARGLLLPAADILESADEFWLSPAPVEGEDVPALAWAVLVPALLGAGAPPAREPQKREPLLSPRRVVRLW
jgi:hypothetical protein